MTDNTHIAEVNKKHWEWSVEKQAGCTLPWLELDESSLRKYASGLLDSPPNGMDEVFPIFPPSLLVGIEGKDVLCLASGGGQQSAVFGLLGANVTVVDIAHAQLDGDQIAAKHYGYSVKAIQGDMRDLSSLEDTYDLVYHANAMSWVPNAGEVYREVSAVTKNGGRYRVDFELPGQDGYEGPDTWDGEAYRIRTPYFVKELRIQVDGSETIQFRHQIGEIFNELIISGFLIQEVHDAPHLLRSDPDATPGSWRHSLMYLGGFAIVAQKRAYPDTV